MDTNPSPEDVVTLEELVDLALCSPEIGAVNFNILRILLHELLENLGIVSQKANLSDLEANQINNFKNYIKGQGTASPMPGVLRYAPRAKSKTPRISEGQTGQISQPTSGKQSGKGHGGSIPRGNQQEQSNLQGEQLQQIQGTGNIGQGMHGGNVHQFQQGFPQQSDKTQGTGGPNRGQQTQQDQGVQNEAQIQQLTSDQMQGQQQRQQRDSSQNQHLQQGSNQTQQGQRGSNGSNQTQQGQLGSRGSNQMDQGQQGQPVPDQHQRHSQTTPYEMQQTQQQQKFNQINQQGLIESGQTQEGQLGYNEGGQQTYGQYAQGYSQTGQAQLHQGQGYVQPQKGQPGYVHGQPGQQGFFQSQPDQQGSFQGQPGHQVSPNRQSGQLGSFQGQPGQQGSFQGQPGQEGSFQGQYEQQGFSQPQQGYGYTQGEHGQQVYGRGQSGQEGYFQQQPGYYDQRGHFHPQEGQEQGFPPNQVENGKLQAQLQQQYAQSEQGGQSDVLSGDSAQFAQRSGDYTEYEGEGGENPYKKTRTSQVDSEPDRGSRSTSIEIEKEDRGSKAMTDDEVYPDHARHSKESDHLTEAHPAVRHQGISHIPVNVSDIPIDELQQKTDPFNDFAAPKILPDGTVVVDHTGPGFNEEFKDQAESVQKELQEQYNKLLELQKEMSLEIQEKMEGVYQKLLRQIAAQNATTSPYMAVGLNAEKCLGPGVCTGFGLPAGTAVCQFPQSPEKVDVCSKDGKVCPGKDVCPGKEVCPTCKDDILHHVRYPGDKGRLAALDLPKPGLSSSKENLLRQMTSMTLLPRDLEELREKMKDRGTVPDVFDEADVLEKLQTLWEAVNVIKNNEENMAVRLVQQDAVLKRIPDGAMDKLERISAGSLDKLEDEGRITGGLKGVKELSAEDIQVIFNNLSSLVIESGAMKEKLQKINDAMLNFESNVVTKSMLVNALNDKADKGQMNTKVSYDEFGAGMDELQSRLGNLLQEVYRKNEFWKEITDQMREELGEKLDKVEIGPLRAYFKNHLGKLEEKVTHLTRIMEEPDPAGTRKKLLKDYNCISCDRHTNISGLTNGPLLPVLGPILAGHSTASQRAFELYRMRPQNNRYDPEGRNFCQMERQGRGDGNFGTSTPLCESDMAHLVNRYVGGSHTAVGTRDRIASIHKRASAAAAAKPNLPSEVPRPKTGSTGGAYYYEE